MQDVTEMADEWGRRKRAGGVRVSDEWTEWGVRRTRYDVGSIVNCKLDQRQAEHYAETWPAELVTRTVRASDWVAPDAACTAPPMAYAVGADPEQSIEDVIARAGGAWVQPWDSERFWVPAARISVGGCEDFGTFKPGDADEEGQ